jgi:hypothetical protein
MGVSRDDMGFAGAQFWKRSTKQGQRRSNTMRIGLKYITPALAAGAAAVAIAAHQRPWPIPRRLSRQRSPPRRPPVAPNIVQIAGHGGGGFHGGGWGGDRGGWHSDRGWGNWFGWRR